MNRWWALEDSFLRSLLERAAAGEDIDVLLLETYANSDSEQVEGSTLASRDQEDQPECRCGHDNSGQTCERLWHASQGETP